MAEAAAVPMWRKVVAAILDFFTIFLVAGYIIARFTGSTTEGGFQLSGVPALILFVVIILYFWLGSRYAGGTIWQRVFRTRG